MSKFKKIPGYSNYSISKKGVVINNKTGDRLKGSFSESAGYISVRITDDDGNTKTWGLHRLLGYVFIPYSGNLSDLVINHKDGIKTNNDLSNLEWVTYQGNAEHAGANCLTDKCIPILVKDAITSEITTYPSMIACARAFGFSKDAIQYRVKSKGQRIFPEKKLYMSVRSDEGWLEGFDLDYELKRNGRASGVTVKHVLTNLEEEFESLTEAAMHLGLKVPTLSVWLDNKNQPVLPGYIQVQKTSELVAWRAIGDPHLELERFTGKRCVVVWNIAGVKVYTSAVECCQSTGLKPTALHYRLTLNSTKPWKDGFVYQYYSDFLKNKVTLGRNA